MNFLPKKKIPLSEPEDEEDLWKDLPDPDRKDEEDEWGHDEMDEEETERPKPPDARLLMDDVRVEYGEVGENPEGAEHPGEASATVGWVVYAALTVIAVLAGTLIYMTVLSETNPEVNPLGIPPMVIEQEEEYPKGKLIADLLGRKDEARELFGRFVHAKSPADAKAMLRHVPGVDEWIQDVPKPFAVPEGWEVPQDSRWEVHTDVDPVFGVLSGYDVQGNPFQAFVVLEQGRLLLDWEATMGQGTAPFSKLVDGQGDASKVRVWIEPATFYPAVYPEKDYRSFHIYTKLEDVPVWAFARRGTVPERELAEMFHKSMFGGTVTKSAMVLISLERGPAGSPPNQWSIADVLHKSWVVP